MSITLAVLLMFLALSTWSADECGADRARIIENDQKILG
jgi:hypothetical protein